MIQRGLPKDKNYFRVLTAGDGTSTWKSVRIPRIVPETSTFLHIKNWWRHQLWKEKKWGREECLNKGWAMLPWTYHVGKRRIAYSRLAMHRTDWGVELCQHVTKLKRCPMCTRGNEPQGDTLYGGMTSIHFEQQTTQLFKLRTADTD